MSYNLVDLNDETRRYMLEELEIDVMNDAVFSSALISPSGRASLIDLHRKAFTAGDPEAFAEAILHADLLLQHQANGNKVNALAASKRLAAGQFGAYYARAVSRRALDSGWNLEVYRARESSSSRPESERLIGQELDPGELLKDLRTNSTDPQAFAILPNVNSGITVKIVR